MENEPQRWTNIKVDGSQIAGRAVDTTVRWHTDRNATEGVGLLRYRLRALAESVSWLVSTMEPEYMQRARLVMSPEGLVLHNLAGAINALDATEPSRDPA